MNGKGVIDDWVDREELRALAEKLLAPPLKPEEAEEEAIFGPDFEGFADLDGEAEEEPEWFVEMPEEENREASNPEEEPETVGRKVATQPDPFRRARETKFQKELSDDPMGRPVARPAKGSPFESGGPARTGLDSEPGKDVAESSDQACKSVTAFVDWLRKQIPLESCLIARGGEGAVLYDDMRAKRRKAVAAMLAAAYQRKGGPVNESSSLVVKLTFGEVMQVIPLGERGGFAALVLPRPLTDGGVRAFVRALTEELAEPSTARHR